MIQHHEAAQMTVAYEHEQRAAQMEFARQEIQVTGHVLAERYQRESMVVEGTRCSIMQSGLNKDWWAFAIQRWCANFNATQKTKEGDTPWDRRFGKPTEFTVYPFGALIFFKKTSGIDQCGKWSDRLSPALLVGVSHGPGMQWDRTYLIVPLGAMIGGKEDPQGEGQEGR